MNSLWARIEPLLARVKKPARHIGCEDDAATPRHMPGKVSWSLASPDTYEIGLPNQGPQILCEILNERDEAVAEPSGAPMAAMFPAADPVVMTARVLRTHQWIERDGVRRENIPGAPGRDAHSGGVRMRRDFINGQQRTRLGGDARRRRDRSTRETARINNCS